MTQNTVPMSDDEAIKTLEGIDDESFYDTDGCYMPDWRPHAVQDFKLTLDGSFTRTELLAMLHFHPNNQKE